MPVVVMINAGTRMQCHDCRSVSRIPVEIIPSHLPLWLNCPHCKATYEWSALPLLPKIPPCDYENRVPLQNWTLCEEDPSKVESSENPEEPVQVVTAETEKEEVVPFWQLAVRAGNLTREIFKHIDIMRQEIDKFAATIITHFEFKWVWATNFARRWQRRYLQEFLDWPFVIVPCYSEEENAMAYGRWVLSPKFFDPGLGVKMYHRGGFRLEFINAYTRMMFPLESEWCEKMNVPHPLNLEVKGNKIIGPSLQFCWRDIDGIIEDRDSTEEWRSVYMQDCRLARLWLASHGVNPWEPRQIAYAELSDREVDQEISKTPAYLRAWQIFASQGRIAVFWPSIVDSRRFACLAALMLKGTTCIFIGGEADHASWIGLFSSYRESYHAKTSEFAYFFSDTAVMWDAVLRSKSIVVDLAHGANYDVLDRLFNYHGRLIVINSDPLGDYFTANMDIAKVYAVTGAQHFGDADWEEWPIHHLRDKDITRTFDELTAYWDRGIARTVHDLPRPVNKDKKKDSK